MKRERSFPYAADHLSTVPDVDPDKVMRSAAAAFKLQLTETVNADPRVSQASKGVVLVYLKYMRFEDYTAYASNLILMARANLKSEGTAGLARKQLLKLGYLKETGRKTVEGCKIYCLENPHQSFVQMHVAEKLAFDRSVKNSRKQPYESKKQSRVPIIGTPQAGSGTDNQHTGVPKIDTNTLDQHLGQYSSETEETFFKRELDNALARETVSLMLNGYSVPASVVEFCVKKLMDGSLRASNIIKIMRTYSPSPEAFSYSKQYDDHAVSTGRRTRGNKARRRA